MILLAQLDAANPGRRATHHPDILLTETNTHSVRSDEHNVILAGGESRLDE